MSKSNNQLEFSPILFDTLFGLIIFFNIDTFLELRDPYHIIFYLLGVVVVIHWWLMFKSTDDYFGTEVTKSALDIFFGILYMVCLVYFVHFAKEFEYIKSLIALISLFTLDLIWALIWQYIGQWQTKNKEVIAVMEHDLNKTIKGSSLALLSLLSLLLLSWFVLSAQVFVIIFGILYIAYIFLTFRQKIIDFRVF